MAAELELPKRLVIHGFLLMEGQKMSKSLGNVLDPFEVIERYGADPLRFYLFREVSFGQDGSVSAAGFETRYETELANEFGNLASRTLAMIDRYREGVVPEAGQDPALREDFEGIVERVCGLIDGVELTQALEQIWERVRRLNQYVEESRPWDLAKDDAAAGQLDMVLYNLAEGLRVTTLLLFPFLPESADRLLDALGEGDRRLADFDLRGGGQKTERLPPLFPKLDAPA
jgi:methionyl-tRNA synthetase